MSAPSSAYLLGYTDHERRRLALQAAFLNPMTEEFLARAGIGAGGNILDLGCGVGDVALILGRLVGPGGRVTAIDVDAEALQVARMRAEDEGLSRIRFEAVDGGPDRLFYEWVAETVRILMPKLEATGLASAAELDLDVLAERLKQEALTTGGSISSPVMIGTFGRKAG